MACWLWALLAVLVLVILGLIGKILLMQRSARELEAGLDRILTQETNTLLTVSTRDRHMRRLAAALNRQLRILRRERQRFQQGDRQLRDAITGAAHDLRTPLTAICGYLDLLTREDRSPEETRYLALMSDRVAAMTALTEELFRYSLLSLPEEEGTRPLRLNTMVEEALAACYNELKKHGITPEVTLPHAPVERTLPPNTLSRVLQNILENAQKYSPGDLSVTLTEEGELLFCNQAPDLTPVDVAHLFDRFYTVRNARHSTGLGLALAHQLTGQMGGRMSAHLEDCRLVIRLFFPS